MHSSAASSLEPHSSSRSASSIASSEVTPKSAPDSQRLVSLDALRGFDMFWIMGGKEIVQALALVTNWPAMRWLEGQLEHPEWHGFAIYDLIFPLFLFIAGVALPFSLEKRIAAGAHKRELYSHIFVRVAALVLLGMIYNGLLNFDWTTMRYPSVLGRIGLAYGLAAIITLNTDVKGRVIWFWGLLVAYWAALQFIPVPGFGAGDLSPGHTLTDFLDRQLLPGVLYRGDRDPCGLLGTVPSIATALAGVLTGDFLQRSNRTGYQKVAVMIGCGAASLALALMWNLFFPINKNLWTSSFVLYCAGWSLLLLAIFYLVVDVWQYRRWAFAFIVIGSNSILIYMVPKFIDFDFTAKFIFGGALTHATTSQPLLWTLCLFSVKWALLLLLYRKKIFLRV